MKDRTAATLALNPEPGQPPVDPLPAATILLVRDGEVGEAEVGEEVLLVLRPPGSSFAPDHWVFPGGRVDPEDYQLDHALLALGPSPREWAAILALENPREAGAYAVAAVREAWEETGILLVVGNRDVEADRSARHELLAGSPVLERHLRRLGLRLATGELSYLGRRVTPGWLPRRFDTRFFLARVDHETRCVLEGDELVAFRWIDPAAALLAAAEGEMNLLPPTVDMLRALVGQRSFNR